MAPWKTKELQELYKEWEQRLKDSGFEDAEQTMGNDRVLKQFSTNFSRQEPLIQSQARSSYYDLLRQRLNIGRIRDRKERYIIRRVAEGAKNSEIHRELQSKGLSINIHTVYLIIRRYEYKWGIRKWTAKQMGLKQLPKRRIRS